VDEEEPFEVTAHPRTFKNNKNKAFQILEIE
jgi:hypothetical protein